MKSAPYVKTLFLFVVLSGYLIVSCIAQAVPDCSRIITNAEIAKNGWTSFRDGQVISIDPTGGVLGVKLNGKNIAVHVTDSTEICNRGKPGKLRDVKVGDRVGGF